MSNMNDPLRTQYRGHRTTLVVAIAGAALMLVPLTGCPLTAPTCNTATIRGAPVTMFRGQAVSLSAALNNRVPRSSELAEWQVSGPGLLSNTSEKTTTLLATESGTIQVDLSITTFSKCDPKASITIEVMPLNGSLVSLTPDSGKHPGEVQIVTEGFPPNSPQPDVIFRPRARDGMGGLPVTAELLTASNDLEGVRIRIPEDVLFAKEWDVFFDFAKLSPEVALALGAMSELASQSTNSLLFKRQAIFIDDVVYTQTVAFGGTSDVSVTWSGEPTFPVTVVVNPPFTCCPMRMEFVITENPLVFPAAIRCTTTSSMPLAFTVALEDAAQLSSEEIFETPVTCVP